MKRKKSDAFNQIKLERRLNKKIILTFLVSFILISGMLPIVFAATTDTVDIQFDPNGDIDLNVDNPEWNFTGINVNEWGNTSAGYFTLYNNGTVSMDTDIRCDNVTWQGAMHLNESTAGPGQDEFAFYAKANLDYAGYVNDSYDAFNTYYDYNLAPNGGTQTFAVGVLIGTSISTNHTGQNFTVYFRGAQTT